MSDKSKNTAQQATAAGGSAINMSLFIQNSMQLKKLLSLSSCSSAKDKTERGLKCDGWDLQIGCSRLKIWFISDQVFYLLSFDTKLIKRDNNYISIVKTFFKLLTLFFEKGDQILFAW